MILYTAIGPQMDVYDGAQQWAALGDENLLSWRKHPANPILTAQLHGAVEIVDWRDPFVFEHNGQTFLLLGGALSEKERKAAVVLLYEALDDTLERWSYRGPSSNIPIRHAYLLNVLISSNWVIVGCYCWQRMTWLSISRVNSMS